MKREVTPSLFSQPHLQRARAPLAERMRPRTLDEIRGQDAAIGPTTSFGHAIRTPDAIIPSVILTGPPGVGKTTIAHVIAMTCNYHFARMSGVLDGVKELRDIVDGAKHSRDADGRPTLVLVDEIHRFNKAQQDAFLPHVESGLLSIIGQTTENVSFRLRNALLSRLRVIELVPLDSGTIEEILLSALTDDERGLGAMELELESDACTYLAQSSGGDVRRALTGLEWAASQAQATRTKLITASLAKESFGTQPIRFDQDGDYHYDIISAFIKSLRGSDPDAALYYMIRALEGGEDPLFITRRMIIFASEDASADPRALQLAVDVDRAVERVGLPEGRIPMAQAACYLASCAKSNATYTALRKMETLVKRYPSLEVPRKLRNAPTDLMKELGNSIGYTYPHDAEGAFVPEHYLPDELIGTIVYEPSDRGLDAQISERLRYLRSLVREQDKKNG